MLPSAYIEHWRRYAPWRSSEFVEQDLILSRVLTELYSSQLIADSLAFRGGTALHKIFLEKPARYSEDLDFVHIKGGRIGSVISEIRKIMDPILTSKPRYKAGEDRATLLYRYQAELPPYSSMRIKIEINTTESFFVEPLQFKTLAYASPWFSGKATITTYSVEELLATKLRALYQRRKGRDLFDLFMSKKLEPDYEKIVQIFNKYLKAENKHIPAALFEQNLVEKLKNPHLGLDFQPLIDPAIQYNQQEAFEYVLEKFLSCF